jgi:hypothetical protein
MAQAQGRDIGAQYPPLRVGSGWNVVMVCPMSSLCHANKCAILLVRYRSGSGTNHSHHIM